MARKLTRWLVAPVVLFVAAMTGTTALAAGPASATGGGDHHRPPPYGPHPCRVMVKVKPPHVDQGGTITVRLSGKCFNDTFTISVIGVTAQPLGTITTDAKGKGSGTFTLPCAVKAGTQFVSAVDAFGNVGVGRFRVRAAAPCTSPPGHQKGGGPPPGHHPHRPGTGSDLRIAGVDASAGVPVGAAVVGSAGLLILSSRKRRQRRDFTG